MKKLLLITLPILFLFTACSRSDARPGEPIDESYWLSQDRAVVAYSDYYCEYYVVETYDGFSLMRSWGGYTPSRGSVLYGNFSRTGSRNFYNRSEGYISQADVRDYWLSYWDAMDLLDWYCAGH